jgi:hypothetical protein
MPVDWSELRPPLSRWNLRTVLRALRTRRRDPWEGYWHASQRVQSRSVQAVLSL